MSAKVWRKNWNHNKQGVFPSFHARICSHLSSPKLCFGQTHLHTATQLISAYLPYLAIKTTADSTRDLVWLWFSYVLQSELVFSPLMGLHLYQTGTTGCSPNQERSWLQLVSPTHVQIHTTKAAHTHTEDTHTLFYPRFCFLFRVPIKHS